MTNNYEKRLTDVESEIKDLFEELNNHITNDNQFLPNRQNTRYDTYAHYRTEEKKSERKLESIVSELKEAEDKKLQIQIVGELVDEIKAMLKEVPRQKNNYRRQVLLMFHETLKQNYTKNLFSEMQVKALTEIAKVCNKAFVTKEQYLKMDDILCECDLDMMPEFLNSTDCARAKAELDTEHMRWKEKGVQCRKDCNQCTIAQFWEKNKDLVRGLDKAEGIQEKMKEPLKCLNEKGEIPKGNACRSLGDCIITLESLELEKGCVVTSNEADYRPICQKTGAQMAVIK